MHGDSQRIEPGPGQESVWDYPRPPRLERDSRRVQVWHEGTLIADTTRAFRILETYHPPTWYLPPDDVLPRALVPTDGTSFCEWKGSASYFDVVTTGPAVRRAAWTYPRPSEPYRALAGYISFYPTDLDCIVDSARVTPQPGMFYGGWVTDDVTGPFKGSVGMDGW